MIKVYKKFDERVKAIVNSKDLTNFKKDPEIQGMLEHVPKTITMQYVGILVKKNADYFTFCKMCDAIGGADTVPYGVSATTLRYMHHAYLILEWAKECGMNELYIVEIGAGYGGLCLAIHHASTKFGVSVKSYTIFDLKHVCELQKLYLSKFKNKPNVVYKDGENPEKVSYNKNNFLVSCYAFSEFDEKYQQLYLKNVFGCADHGFLAWNTPLIDIGKNCTIKDEEPTTAIRNKHIFF